ncbi:hypothetical protein G6514_008481 [Epicoccum nigrum]|nr:hypothetical protein G6514_008481 [Epicoccum nigrum]
MIFGHQYDLYPDHYATQVFNAYRIMRLDMTATIRRLSGRSSAAQDVVMVTQDICASAPQFVLPGARLENTMPLSPLQKLQCYGLLTPLYVAAQITTDDHMRDWILQSLAFMTDNGVKMAGDVSHILTSSPETDYWVVFAMVGSCGITA